MPWSLRQSSAMLLIWLSVISLVSTQPPECIQYYLSSSPSLSSPQLQCSAHLTSCHYITTPTTRSLPASESQLSDILSQVRPALTNGELRRQCLDGFLFLYCLQVYSVCGRVVGGAFEAGGGGICAEDCIQLISGECSEGEWALLSNLVTQLRDNGIVALPALVQLEDCNITYSTEQLCLSPTQQANSTTPPEDCTITQAPPTPSSSSPALPSPLTTGAIVGICIGVTLTLTTTTLLLFLILCLARRQSITQSKPSSAPSIEAKSEDMSRMQEIQAYNDQRQSSGTLMLRASTVHEALLNINLSRTTTLSKRIKDGAFLGLSPKHRLQQLEYPRGNICLVRDLWETNFGPVYVGEASGLDHSNALTSVFIKSLRNGANTKLRQQFQIEMTWASGFSHPNIISLLGVCLKEEPHYMMYEYLEYGSLKDFLQSISSMWFDFDRFLGDSVSREGDSLQEEGPNQSMFGVEDLTGMACQVADGMDYLAKKAFVLKDLAARNCQVGHKLQIKIANFGLSFDRRSEDYCCIRSHKSTPVSLRWLAPEAIRHNKVSVFSDIWSFGILLWEIFSFGARPYSDFTNAEVVQGVLSGHVLSRPDRCPQGVYDLMLRCWNTVPSKRPWFHTLRPELANVPKVMGSDERRMSGWAPPTPEIAHVLRTNL